MSVILENDRLRAEIKKAGAELVSLVKKETGVEYMWNADPAYWGRTAPILFPFVGKLKGLSYEFDGVTYAMGQHGFARDCEFEVESSTETEAWFTLRANEDTLKKYPFDFVLKLGYVLEGKELKVIWHVENADNKEMYFSIGGHPAFMCPLNGEGKQTDYYLGFDNKEVLDYNLIDGNGLVDREDLKLDTSHGMMPITEHLFDEDALIIEKKQLLEVSLCTPQKVPYLTVKFNTPLVGIWSPAKKGAPFICIEPWNGRCDHKDYDGKLKDRAYSNTLQPGEVFENSYVIEVR